MFYFELFQDVDDVDKENLHDVAQASLYANDIFKYYKEREVYYNVIGYIDQGWVTPRLHIIYIYIDIKYSLLLR